MLEKIIVPHTYGIPEVNVIMPSDHFGVKCARDESVSACGRKPFYCGGTCATKQANEGLKDFVRNLKPDAKYLYLHIIAMGSGEYFGPNTNGDYFPEDGLLKKYDTFRTFAHLFKHHVNKDPKQSYGHVPYSTYNEPMRRVELIVAVDKGKAPDIAGRAENGEPLAFSMACFPPGTPVLLKDGSEVAIDKTAVGMQVRTHTGGVGAVDQLMQREYNGDAISFRAYGLPDELFCTANHKIWTRPIVRGKTKCPVCCKEFKMLNSHLWQSRDIQHQHAYRNYEKYTEGMMKADELCHGDYVRTPFSTTVTEKGDENYARILGYYLAEGSIFNNEKYPSSHCVDFTFHIKEDGYAEELVDCLKREGCKRISVYKQPEKTRQIVRSRDSELLKRLLGDAGRLSHKLCLSEKIMDWSPEVQMYIFNKYINGDGYFNKNIRQIKGVTTSRRLAFQLATIAWRNNICANIQCHRPKNKKPWYCVAIASSDINKLASNKIPEDFDCVTEYKMDIGHLKNQQKGLVVKRKITQKCSYIENGFVYRKIYRIQKRRFSGTVHNISVEGDSSYVVNGVAVSNCKIPWDRCSVCNNKAQRKSEYCDHIRNHLLEIMSDGKQVFMVNEDPTFFDISYVIRPADKTAMMLSKVASQNNVSVNSSVIAKKNASGSKTGSIQKEFETILEPAISEEQQEGVCKYVMPLLKNAEPDLPVDNLKGFSLNNILSTLGLCGIVCKPHEYKRILIMTGDNGSNPQIDYNDFDDSIYQAIKHIIPERSFYNPHIETRILRLSGNSEKDIQKEADSYIIKSPRTREPKDSSLLSLSNLLFLGAAGGGAYAAYQTALGKKLLKSIASMIEKKPGKFFLVTGLGAAALGAAPSLREQPVTDSLLRYRNSLPHGVEGIIVNTKQSSQIPRNTQTLLKKAMDPFGMLYLKKSFEKIDICSQ